MSESPSSTADANLPGMTEEEIARMRFKKAVARNKRKRREAEGEVKELNIVAMMDMMTIILVFLLGSYSASTISTASSGDIAPPVSTTRLAPKDTIAITVSRCSADNIAAGKCKAGSGVIMVGTRNVVPFQDDQIDPQYKQGGADGMLVAPLKEALDKEVEKAKYIAQYNPAAPFTGELSVIADRNMPYRLLTEILYTAGQAELDSYRFVAIKKEGGESSPSAAAPAP